MKFKILKFLLNYRQTLIKWIILALCLTFASKSVCSDAAVDYGWNENNLVVNVTGTKGVGIAQVKLNISSDLITGSASSGGFMAGASHMQSGTEHRWFRLTANGDTNGTLEVPITCSHAAGSYEIELISISIRDKTGDSIPLAAKLPMRKTINCGGNTALENEINESPGNLTANLEEEPEEPAKPENANLSFHEELPAEKLPEVNDTKKQENENEIIDQALPAEPENITGTATGELKNITPGEEKSPVKPDTSASDTLKHEAQPQKETSSNHWVWVVVILSMLILMAIIIKKL